MKQSAPVVGIESLGVRLYPGGQDMHAHLGLKYVYHAGRRQQAAASGGAEGWRRLGIESVVHSR